MLANMAALAFPHLNQCTNSISPLLIKHDLNVLLSKFSTNNMVNAMRGFELIVDVDLVKMV